jgi:hypothetical protein
MLKWDRQESMYFPVSINLHEKGAENVTRGIDEFDGR